MLKISETQFHREALASGLRLIGDGIKQRAKGSRLFEFIKCGHHQEIRLSDVRILNFRCQLCFSNELAETAKNAGLKLLGQGRNANYRLCKFIACSHEQEIQLVRIRDGQFRCQQCFDDNLNQSAAKAGLKIVGRGSKNGSRLYEFRCGHQQEIFIQKVDENVYKCRTCSEDTLKKEAADAGLLLVGSGKTGDYRTYQFACGHQQEMQPGHVRGGRFRCKQCLKDKSDLLAAKSGLRLVEGGRTGQYKTYKFIDCGHQQEMLNRNARDKKAICLQCLEDRFNEEAKQGWLRIVGAGQKSAYRSYEFIECEHQQKLRITHVRDGSFTCRICNPDAGGFNADKPATFYVYNLESVAMRTTGFGITSNETARRSAHKYCLHRHGFIITDIRIWPREHGLTILKLEDAVKRKFVLDKDMAKVSGFKRESTKAPFSEVCAFVDHWMAKYLASFGKLSSYLDFAMVRTQWK